MSKKSCIILILSILLVGTSGMFLSVEATSWGWPDIPVATYPEDSAVPAVATDNNNNVYIVWEDDRAVPDPQKYPAPHIYREERDQGGGLLGNEFHVGKSSSAYLPRIASYENGLHMVWVERYRIWVSDPGHQQGGWWEWRAKLYYSDGSDKQSISDDVYALRVSVGVCDIASDGSIVWISEEEGAGWKYKIRYKSLGSEPVDLSTSTSGFYSVRIAVKDSNVYVVWSDYSQGRIHLRRSDDGGQSWKDTQHLTELSAWRCYQPVIAVDRYGNVNIAYLTATADPVGMVYERYDSSVSTRQAEPYIMYVDDNAVGTLAITSNPFAGVELTLSFGWWGFYYIHIHTYTDDGDFVVGSAGFIASDSSVQIRYSDIATDPEGNVLVAWNDGYSSGDVYYKIGDGAPGPPLNLTGKWDWNNWPVSVSYEVSWNNPHDLSGISKAYYRIYDMFGVEISSGSENRVGISSMMIQPPPPLGVGSTVRVWLEDGNGNSDEEHYAQCYQDIYQLPLPMPGLELSDLTSWSTTYTDDQEVRVEITRDDEADRWLLTEDQSYTPDIHAPWSADKPTGFQLSAGDGEKKVYLWVMQSTSRRMNLGPASATIELILPGDALDNPTLVLKDKDTDNTEFTDDVEIKVEIEDVADASAWLLTESPVTPQMDDPNWESPKPAEFTLSDEEGEKTVYVWVKDDTDSRMNMGPASATIKLDTTPPGIPTITSLTHPDQDTWYNNNDPEFEWTEPSDNLSGIAGYRYVLDQTATTEPGQGAEEGTGTSKSYTDVADGIWYFHVRARDGAGNWGGTAHYRVMIDTTPEPDPALSVSPLSLDFGDSIVSLTITVSNTGGGTLDWTVSESLNWLSLDKDSGSLSAGGSEDVTATVDRTVVTPGPYSGTISFTSDYGSQNVSASMTVPGPPNAPTDLGPPNYVDGSWGNDNIPTLEFTQSDPNPSDTLEYRIQIDTNSDFSSPEVDHTSELIAQGETSYTSPLLSDGTYYWRVMSTDNSGASSVWSTANGGAIAFKIDTIPPTGTILINDGDDYTNSISVTLTLPASDSGSGVSKMKFSNDGLVWSVEEDYTTSKAWMLTPDNGPKIVYVQYKDNAGNWSDSDDSINDTIILDTQNPTVELKVDENKSRTLYDGEIVGVLPDAWMEARFSEVMNKVSAEDGLKLIAVKDNLNETINEEVSLNFNWDSSTKTVKLTPQSGELNKNHLYRLQVTDKVKDIAGNTVEGEREIIFRTIMYYKEKNVVPKLTNERLMVTLEANALTEDGYLIINTEPLTYQFKVDPDDINVANEKSITKGCYPVEGCLWEIKVCKKNGDWMEDKFGSEVKVTFPYDEDKGMVGNAPIPLREELLLAFWLNEEHSNWERIPGSRVDKENNVVITGEIPHFSVYALMGSAVHDLSGALVYPVPWKPNDGKDDTGTEEDGITFSNLSAEGVIKIYSISGELVKEYDYKPGDEGEWIWDVKTSNREKVFSGVYIYYIKNEKEHKTGKLIIIR